MSTDVSALQRGISVLSDQHASLRDVSSSKSELTALKGSLEQSVSGMRADPMSNISTLTDLSHGNTGTPLMGGSVGGDFGSGFNSSPANTNKAIGDILAKEGQGFLDVGKMTPGIPGSIQSGAGSSLLSEATNFLNAPEESSQKPENKHGGGCCCPCCSGDQKPPPPPPIWNTKPSVPVQPKPKEDNNENEGLAHDIQDCINKLGGKENEVKDNESKPKPTPKPAPEQHPEKPSPDGDCCCPCECNEQGPKPVPTTKPMERPSGDGGEGGIQSNGRTMVAVPNTNPASASPSSTAPTSSSNRSSKST